MSTGVQLFCTDNIFYRERPIDGVDPVYYYVVERNNWAIEYGNLGKLNENRKWSHNPSMIISFPCDHSSLRQIAGDST